MKRKMKIKEFLTRKKVAAGCVAAAAVIAAGSFSMVMQSADIPELSSYTDPVIETTITGDDTPLASKPKVTTKTTSKTKTTRKKIKLKKASKKSYTKKLPNKKKTTTKTKKSGKTTVKTQTTVQTATSEKYTKKSKQKVVTQKVVTTVKTTTTVENAQTQSAPVQSTGTHSTVSVAAPSTKTASKQTISNVSSIAPKMDSRVLNAYSRMGFTVTIDPGYAYAGHFDARSRNITIQEADETIYHELGHFLAFIAGNVDQSSAFASVYNSEKSKFTGYNRAYATQNASEYFAESVKDYMLNGAALSSQRPETYKAIQSALNTVTTARADAILKAYASIWN